ncbi:4'-phosphopantetheinyl transferase [Bradyrhizobium sp. F1.4.3]|uniref:4'-phosphopantetheinyl transferase family protein n=1 Tax=Bradyrhizobium sp. F1.4.3 TaxID=3156356 RepID=UPI0033981891
MNAKHKDVAECTRPGILSSDEVRVWHSTLDVSRARLASLYQLLSPGERERAGRFRSIADAKRSIIGRGYLRLLLGRAIGLRAEELRFEYDEFGKPSLATDYRSELQFSVSHSGDCVLIALARGRAVGADVERVRTDIDVADLAKRFFSTTEAEKLACLTGPVLYKAFFACWTCKEAYVKAKGQGISLPLNDFEVAFLPGEAPGLLTTRPDPTEASRWKLFALNVGQYHEAALIAAGQDWHFSRGTLEHIELPNLGKPLIT